MPRNEDILRSTIDGTDYDGLPQSREEELLIELKETIEAGGGGGGGGTTNYNALSNKPKINGTELSGNKTLNQLGIQAKLTFDNSPTPGSDNPVKSNGVYGAILNLQEGVTSRIEGKVDKETGKALSSNDYTIEEKTKLDGIEAGAEKNIITEIRINGEPVTPVNRVVSFNMLTKAVNDLVNYYKKSEIYTKSEVEALINSISTLTLDIVEELPTSDISTTTIYLVPVTGGTNVYMQYAYINDAWAQLGTTQVDLTNYYTKAQADALLAAKQDQLTFDNTPTANSDNPVKSGGVKTALDAKQDTLVFDVTPTEDSTNVVNSGVVYAALLAKLAEAKGYTDSKIADFGGYQKVPSLEDITNPSTKMIYLVKDSTATGDDKYNEYIYSIVEGVGTFEKIGDTSFTINVATTTTAGIVKPDGETITVDNDGTIHAAPSVEFDEEDFNKEDDLVSLSPSQRIFYGTQAQWDALSTAIKKTYGQANITDDESGTPEYYSTEETKTNKVWIDGNDIYRKVVITGAASSDTTFPTGLPDSVSDYWIDLGHSYFIPSGSTNRMPISYPHPTTSAVATAWLLDRNTIQLRLGTSQSVSKMVITIEYTKEG